MTTEMLIAFLEARAWGVLVLSLSWDALTRLLWFEVGMVYSESGGRYRPVAGDLLVPMSSIGSLHLRRQMAALN